ncbi:MAG: hypothetical protein FWG49_00080 [Leptospirales bacterium]|nr:hypothetical protein [Leptospirales bacterium]
MRTNKILLFILFSIICTLYSCTNKFEVSGEQHILDEVDILIQAYGNYDDITCFKYIKGKEILSLDEEGGYTVYLKYKDSLYFFKNLSENPYYIPYYKTKKIKIIEENGVFKACWLVLKEQEGHYYCRELKPMSELLKDSIHYNPGWPQLIKEMFQNLENK